MGKKRAPVLDCALIAIRTWAHRWNQGSLYYPGPADYSKPMGSEEQHADPDLWIALRVDSMLEKQGDPPAMRALLFHIHWHGKPLSTFKREARGRLQTGADMEPQYLSFLREVGKHFAHVLETAQEKRVEQNLPRP